MIPSSPVCCLVVDPPEAVVDEAGVVVLAHTARSRTASPSGGCSVHRERLRRSGVRVNACRCSSSGCSAGRFAGTGSPGRCRRRRRRAAAAPTRQLSSMFQRRPRSAAQALTSPLVVACRDSIAVRDDHAVEVVAIAGQPGGADPVIERHRRAIVVAVAVRFKADPGQAAGGGLVECVELLTGIRQIAAVLRVMYAQADPIIGRPLRRDVGEGMGAVFVFGRQVSPGQCGSRKSVGRRRGGCAAGWFRRSS